MASRWPYAQAPTALVTIYVDCTAKGSHPELQQKYGVSGYPTVLFVGPDGATVGVTGSWRRPLIPDLRGAASCAG